MRLTWKQVSKTLVELCTYLHAFLLLVDIRGHLCKAKRVWRQSHYSGRTLIGDAISDSLFMWLIEKNYRFGKIANNEWCLLTCPELDALGDELLFDDDSTYLDEASTAPSIPEGIPGDKSTNRVFHIFIGFFFLAGRELFNSQGFCVSGWCFGGRVWTSSDSCFVREQNSGLVFTCIIALLFNQWTHSLCVQHPKFFSNEWKLKKEWHIYSLYLEWSEVGFS